MEGRGNWGRRRCHSAVQPGQQTPLCSCGSAALTAAWGEPPVAHRRRHLHGRMRRQGRARGGGRWLELDSRPVWMPASFSHPPSMPCVVVLTAGSPGEGPNCQTSGVEQGGGSGGDRSGTGQGARACRTTALGAPSFHLCSPAAPGGDMHDIASYWLHKVTLAGSLYSPPPPDGPAIGRHAHVEQASPCLAPTVRRGPAPNAATWPQPAPPGSPWVGLGWPAPGLPISRLTRETPANDRAAQGQGSPGRSPATPPSRARVHGGGDRGRLGRRQRRRQRTTPAPQRVG